MGIERIYYSGESVLSAILSRFRLSTCSAERSLNGEARLSMEAVFLSGYFRRARRPDRNFTNNAKKQRTFLALMLFVGIPLPGTGAWTGTLAASMLDLDKKKSTVAVMCGVVYGRNHHARHQSACQSRHPFDIRHF